MNVLVIDVGGTSVKVLATGQNAPRVFPSGPTLTADQMVLKVRQVAEGWKYEVASIGVPAPVVNGRPVEEPRNLGPGWVRFDYEEAFGCPVKMMNDASMQALGSYEGGRMLFVGLGTGLGTALIVNGAIQPMELARLPYKRGTFEDYLGIKGLERLGLKKWRQHVFDLVNRLTKALQLDDVVIGGGNVRKLDDLPPLCRKGHNDNAFRGGFLMWEEPGHTYRATISEACSGSV
jgi:polyphosphate glucokinase